MSDDIGIEKNREYIIGRMDIREPKNSTCGSCKFFHFTDEYPHPEGDCTRYNELIGLIKTKIGKTCNMFNRKED